MAFMVRATAPTVCAKAVVPMARASRVVARAEAVETPPKFTVPQLDASTPSPIFGGSTGGLLRKAQVRPQELQQSIT
jgi:hypothetical protein